MFTVKIITIFTIMMTGMTSLKLKENILLQKPQVREKMVMMKVWLVGDSGTGPGDISPGPFCPITRLLCGHRAPKPILVEAIPQYSRC